MFEFMNITFTYDFIDNFFCSFVVEQILSGETRETIVENIHSKLMEVGEKVRNGDVPIELYYITKVQYILKWNFKVWIVLVRRSRWLDLLVILFSWEHAVKKHINY